MERQRSDHLTAHCEHAECLQKDPNSPTIVGQKVYEKVAFSTAAYINFDNLVQQLKSAIAPIDLHTPEHIEQIQELLRTVRINDKEWMPYSNFRDHKYTRNLVGFDERFTVLLLCWNKQQASPIHDHAGSSCWVKCLHGSLTETLYKKEENGDALVEIKKGIAQVNDVCYINDSYGLHRMANDSDTDVCVTLHIYSPPYQFCHAYNMDGSRRQVCMLAANAPYEAFFDVAPKEERSLERFSKQIEAIGEAPKDKLQESVWTRQIYEALQEMVITPEEWRKFTHFSEYRYSRSMVYADNNFSIIICCWMPGQKNPIHVHGKGTHSWFRVLAGQLDLSFYDNNQNHLSTTTFTCASPPFFEGEGQEFHSVGNNSQNIAVSIHVYSPPYKHLQYNFSDRENASEVIPVSYCDKYLGGNTCGPCCTPNCTEVVFTSFEAFERLLDAEFAHPRDDDERCISVMDLLERSTFPEQEIEEYAKLRPTVGDDLLLHRTPKFMITLQFWKRGHQTTVHDHSNGATWMKLLRGRLSDISYDYNESTKQLSVSRTSMLLTDSLSFMAKNLKHSLRNGMQGEAVTLHITAPPIDRCNHYSASGAVKPQMFVFRDQKDPLQL